LIEFEKLVEILKEEKHPVSEPLERLLSRIKVLILQKKSSDENQESVSVVKEEEQKEEE